MELKTGMYVRIKDGRNIQYIGELINVNEFREPSLMYCVDIQASDYVFISGDAILNASDKIVELIKVGDYVNGEKVVETDIKGKLRYLDKNRNLSYVEDLDIKSIVTKEIFESMSYKVEV